MAQPSQGSSEPPVAVPPPLPPDVRVELSRIPYGDYFTLTVTKDGRVSSEELEPDEARAWFKARGIRDDEALEKALDETWNFYQAVVTIAGDVYREPTRPFPKFQPQV